MLIWFILTLVVIAAIATFYILIVRPVLRRLSFLKSFWADVDARELSFWQKVQELFDGMKIKLLARIMWVPALIVQTYDGIGPYIAGADFTPLTAAMPWWVNVVANIGATVGIPMLIDWARSYSTEPATTSAAIGTTVPPSMSSGS